MTKKRFPWTIFVFSLVFAFVTACGDGGSSTPPKTPTVDNDGPKSITINNLPEDSVGIEVSILVYDADLEPAAGGQKLKIGSDKTATFSLYTVADYDESDDGKTITIYLDTNDTWKGKGSHYISLTFYEYLEEAMVGYSYSSSYDISAENELDFSKFTKNSPSSIRLKKSVVIQ